MQQKTIFVLASVFRENKIVIKYESYNIFKYISNANTAQPYVAQQVV